ncbi:hypothetical protein LY90DRAFT_105093 [Neocallimastix californiae]|uniref:Uncharacterized protein n=1 Tax=Neocallimastix californiae TaxID=1754190 RepID=A0A1Y2AW34_9FUNG|nr:hypothetical protein LY90DRAFT_105093 [Neocallimastix californiae]|eukprot:ORY26115.1 hypothetical protein LY90DRAFT_105093 [Neocallimastix californiae]
MNNIYQQLDEIKILWKQLKHYDTKKFSLSTQEEDNTLNKTEDEILSGPEATKKLENISQQLKEIIENENKFKEKIIKQIKGIISSIKYFCEILSLDNEQYKEVETFDSSSCLIEKKENYRNWN